MNLYKSMLLSIIQPITEYDLRLLRQYADGLQRRGEQHEVEISVSVAETIRRAAKFIEMSLSAAQESKAQERRNALYKAARNLHEAYYGCGGCEVDWLQLIDKVVEAYSNWLD